MRGVPRSGSCSRSSPAWCLRRAKTGCRPRRAAGSADWSGAGWRRGSSRGSPSHRRPGEGRRTHPLARCRPAGRGGDVAGGWPNGCEPFPTLVRTSSGSKGLSQARPTTRVRPTTPRLRICAHSTTFLRSRIPSCDNRSNSLAGSRRRGRISWLRVQRRTTPFAGRDRTGLVAARRIRGIRQMHPCSRSSGALCGASVLG